MSRKTVVIRISLICRIRTSDRRIGIQEAKKHTDPTVPDPQHCFNEIQTIKTKILKACRETGISKNVIHHKVPYLLNEKMHNKRHLPLFESKADSPPP
jgi:hypothetical protein